MDRTDEIAIDVWQFVRIMVALEGGAKGAAWSAWSEVWEELDARLDALRERDPPAFAELMMRQQVVLPMTNRRHRAEAAAALDSVLARLDASLKKSDLDAAAAKHLRFEHRELTALRRTLAPLADQRRRRPPKSPRHKA